MREREREGCSTEEAGGEVLLVGSPSSVAAWTFSMSTRLDSIEVRRRDLAERSASIWNCWDYWHAVEQFD